MFQQFVRGTAATIISLMVGLSSVAAQEAGVPQKQTTWPAAMPNHRATAKLANHSTSGLKQKQSALARMTSPSASKKEHHLILQVNTNDAAAMNLALNNATNVTQYYKELGEKSKIEVITYGPGLHMLRNDTSPVKARIEEMALSTPEVSFKACGNTQERMQKAENKDIPIVPQAQVVKSGVVRVMELQEQGWAYVKP
jgi:intracellular sulfur oxidation DsrE/DsrF family protein